MKNQVIEVLDREHGKKVIEYWKSKGVDTGDAEGTLTREARNCARFYGVINGHFSYFEEETVEAHKAEIITLPEDKPYPKVMEVSDCGRKWVRRVVFMEKNGAYLAWSIAETLEDAETSLTMWPWKYAREIEEDPIVEITIEEIAKLKGVSVDQIRIKD